MAVKGIFKNDQAKTINPQELPNRLSTNILFSIVTKKKTFFVPVL